ncbi:hypothetical protein [Ammoniphilus sp. CFH 90114]|nr:hypothetical protein [Ammoniphilus sp. CFH 90114]
MFNLIEKILDHCDRSACMVTWRELILIGGGWATFIVNLDGHVHK